MIILPDIHGRSFWRKAVKDHENEEIIFLGDYLDPYPWEDIDADTTWENFLDIIAFKEEHMDNVILLYGNHDMHYIRDDFANGGRMNYNYKWRYRDKFVEKRHLFQMAYEKKINNQLFVFTHAGLHLDWLNSIYIEPKEGISDVLNSKFVEKSMDFINALSDVSRYRGGWSTCGSMLWADVNEHLDDAIEEKSLPFYQIFGHTQQEKDPIINDKFACLDCRKAFILTDKGELKDYEEN